MHILNLCLTLRGSEAGRKNWALEVQPPPSSVAFGNQPASLGLGSYGDMETSAICLTAFVLEERCEKWSPRLLKGDPWGVSKAWGGGMQSPPSWSQGLKVPAPAQQGGAFTQRGLPLALSPSELGAA